MDTRDIRRLVKWYRLNRRDLPWRHDPTPYHVWISETMLQQTQVRTVVPYYERFIAQLPDIRSLAAARESEVLEAWAGLGYYRRARNLHQAARKIVSEFGGEFPGTFAETISLPGIGWYTAGAILSIAFNQFHPAVDGNVRRVIVRLLGLRKPRQERFFRDCASAWMGREQPAEFNQALMELGALVCIPGRPRCPVCPLGSACVARESGLQDTIPAVRVRKAGEKFELVVLVVSRGHEVLVCRQLAGSFIPGEWGLPSLQVRGGQNPVQLARRLARATLGCTPKLDVRGHISHTVVHRRIAAHIFSAAVSGTSVPGDARWLAADKPAQLTSSFFRKAIHAALGPARSVEGVSRFRIRRFS